MPIPEPKSDETENEFVGRCFISIKDDDEWKSDDQRFAVCYSAFNKKSESVSDLLVARLLEDPCNCLDKLRELTTSQDVTGAIIQSPNRYMGCPEEEWTKKLMRPKTSKK